MRILIVLCLVLSVFACKPKREKEVIEDKKIQSVEAIMKVTTPQELIDFTELTKKELSELEHDSKTGRMIIYDNSNILKMLTDGGITYYPFGKANDVEFIKQLYKNIFEIEEQKISHEFSKEVQVVNKLSFGNSFLKLYYNSTTKRTDIVSGRIVDKQIGLNSGIRIGQSKKEFFKKIFLKSDRYNFSLVDTVWNGNEPGDIQQVYIFKKGNLKEIIFKSDYDWIPFELN